MTDTYHTRLSEANDTRLPSLRTESKKDDINPITCYLPDAVQFGCTHSNLHPSLILKGKDENFTLYFPNVYKFDTEQDNVIETFVKFASENVTCNLSNKDDVAFVMKHLAIVLNAVFAARKLKEPDETETPNKKQKESCEPSDLSESSE